MDKSFIDKILELSEFTLKLYHYEIEQTGQKIGQHASSAEMERLILMNFNPNFSAYSLDYMPALKLVKTYLKGYERVEDQELPMILSNTTLQYIHRIGLHTPNLEQKILSLKVLYNVLLIRN